MKDDGQPPKATGFDEEMIIIVLDEDSDARVAVYLERCCKAPGTAEHRQANLSFVSTSITMGLYNLSPSQLRELARFLSRYAKHLEDHE